MTNQEKSLNKVFVNTINTWFAKEGLIVDRPKRENTRTFKVGRRHRVKYHRVTFKHSKDVQITFKVGNIHVYIDLDEWPPQVGSTITIRQRYVFKVIKLEVIKLEPDTDSVGYITLEDIEEIR